jgi:hypothetical protein
LLDTILSLKVVLGVCFNSDYVAVLTELALSELFLLEGSASSRSIESRRGV